MTVLQHARVTPLRISHTSVNAWGELLIQRWLTRRCCPFLGWWACLCPHPQLVMSVQVFPLQSKAKHLLWPNCCAPESSGCMQSQAVGSQMNESTGNTEQSRWFLGLYPGSLDKEQRERNDLLLHFSSGLYCVHIGFEWIKPVTNNKQIQCRHCEIIQTERWCQPDSSLLSTGATQGNPSSAF